MSEEEWTVKFVSEIANKSGFQELVALHNAALAAEREQGVKVLAERSFELHECQQQLAAEHKQYEELAVASVDKIKTLVEALKAIANHATGENEKRCLGCAYSKNTTIAALAKVKEARFEAQLAEREQKSWLERMLNLENQQLREQFAATVEALKILLDSAGCLHGEEAEIPEEISAQFDINLDDARKVVAALEKVGK